MTVPAPSVPGTKGKCGRPGFRQDPSRIEASQLPTPTVSSSITTSCEPGFGTGRRCSVRTDGGPNRSIAAAFMRPPASPLRLRAPGSLRRLLDLATPIGYKSYSVSFIRRICRTVGHRQWCGRRVGERRLCPSVARAYVTGPSGRGPAISGSHAHERAGRPCSEAPRSERNSRGTVPAAQRGATAAAYPIVGLIHSHSMVLSHGNALIFQRNFFLLTVKARLASRQNFSLMISKENSRDSVFARFRGLSTTIGRCSTSSTTQPTSGEHRKTPSAL